MADNLAVTPGSGAIVAAEDVGGVLYQRVFMGRSYVTESLIISAGTALTEELDLRRYAGGIVIIPAAWTAANLGIYISPTSAGTFVILRDYLGSPVQINGIEVAGSRAYQIPEDAYACGYIKFWSKSAVPATEADVNQVAERSLTVILKG